VSAVKIIVLGAGDAFGSGGRRQSSYLVRSAKQTFLMDAGASVLPALKDAGVRSDLVDFVLVSHLHGDHFAGLVFMLMEYQYEQRRDRELVVAGPAGTEERVRELFRAMYRESSQEQLRFPLRFVALEPGQRITFGEASVEPFGVPHQKSEPSLGFRVEVDGRVVVYSGDSGWTEEFVEQTRDADLFLCECCFYDTRVDFHVNYPEFERNRDRIRARRVVLTHLGREVLSKLDQVHAETAYDGMVIDL